MRVSAKLKYANISAQKCRLVAAEVRGQPAAAALQTLTYMPKKSARILKKVLDSAIANAEHNHGADIDELKVSNIQIDVGPGLRRYRARAKGRGTRILKRNSHITVEVADE